MKKNCLFVVSHGSGAQLMSISVIGRELSTKYENLYIVSHNKYFADCLADELPNVHSVSYQELPQLTTTIMLDKSHWDFLNDHPYNTGKFALREDNFYDAYRELVGLPRKNDWDKNGTDTLPVLNEIPISIVQAAKDFASQHPNFVMVQFQGGVNPIGERHPENINAPEVGLKRRYPPLMAEKVVEHIKSFGYEVLQYCLPEEIHIKGCFYLQQEQNQLFYYELSKYCKFVVCIDSSLLHLSIANAPKVFTIWNQTEPIGFGYKKAYNIPPKRFQPIAPYFAGIPESPYLEYVEPETINEMIDNYINPNKK